MRELRKLNLNNMVFLDIETVRENKELDLNSQEFDAWAYMKRRNGESDTDLQASYKKEAGLHAEFSRIVCITVGRVVEKVLKVVTYNDEDEAELLRKFNSDLNKVLSKQSKTMLCGHAITGFDAPFIFKRCMTHQIEPCELLETANEKPWTLTARLIDTKDLWKGSAFKATSLIAVANALRIPSPKDDISGAEVGDVYWEAEEGYIERISVYCEKDVLTTANVVRRCRFEPLLTMVSGTVYTPPEPILESLMQGGAYTKDLKEALVKDLTAMTYEDRAKAFKVLDSIVSTARGKKTKITKAHVRTLKKQFDE